MSGHSKWASIKHKKGALDLKRGRIFSRIIREMTVAARDGGGDPDANPRLRTVIMKAKEANMPADNIERAIKKGTGELPGVSFEEITYEGYGPGGVAVLVEAVTDNKNRTSSDIRNIFSKKGGNMAGEGSVSWIFQKKGYILIDKSKVDEESLMDIALEGGAEDMKSEDKDSYEITTALQDFEKVRSALEEKGIPIANAELTMIPTNTIALTAAIAKKALALVEALEEQDDVQNVYANFDIPDEVME